MVGSYCPYVSGPVLVKVNLRDGLGFQNLGYTADGVQLEETFLTNPIYADQYGGNAGPEVDRQFMGKTARVGLSLTTYSMSVVKKMVEGQAATNWAFHLPGTIVDIGALITCGNSSIQVLLLGEADVKAEATAVSASVAAGTTPLVAVNLNLPNCWYDGPVKFPIGSKNTVFDFDLKVTPFTTDPTRTANASTETILWMENPNRINNLATYVRGIPN